MPERIQRLRARIEELEAELAALPEVDERSRAMLEQAVADIQAALGLGQLARLDAWIARRGEIAARYDRALAGIDGVRTLRIRPGVRHARHLYVVRLDAGELGIVYLSGGYHLLAREHTEAVRRLSETHVPDLSVGTDDDDEEFPVPDDLIW